MAKGFGHFYYTILDTTVKPNNSKGIFIHDLRLLTEFYVTNKQIDVKYAHSMLTPLTEMYLVTNKIEHVFQRNRDGIFVSGVCFKKAETRDLVETIALGIGQSKDTAEEIARLSTLVFGS